MTKLSSKRPLAVLLLAVGFLAGCASTQQVVTGTPRPEVSADAVRVYQVPPKRYEEVARIEAKSGIGFGTQGQTNSAIDRLARAAAKLGANGVLLLGVDTVRPPVQLGVGTGVARRNVGAYGSVGIPTAQRHAAGLAIHVIEE